MQEEVNLKPLNINNEEKISNLELPQTKKENQNIETNYENLQITNLPSWNIEPPLEIKRNNE